MTDPSIDAIFVQSLDIGGDGPRVAIKDCIDIAGTTTGCGSAAFANAAPASVHAEAVEALLARSCRIVGKTNMHELAYGVTGQNEITGTPINPRFPDLIVGGSSSGSAAAVAAGLVDFAIGTDTGGSIRMPAACCAVFGMKPTYGAVSRKGASPAQSSLDCIGPFAGDMTILTGAMAMICPGFDDTYSVGQTKLARIECEAEPEIQAALDAVIRRCESDFSVITLPSFEEAYRAGIAIIGAEMALQFAHLLGQGLLQPDVEARLAKACELTDAQVAEAEAVRTRFTHEVDAALATYDALVLPTLPVVPITLQQAGDAAAAVRLTELVRPFNLSGHPAISLPTLTAAGLPAGVQVVGRKGADDALCAIGRTLEGSL